MGQKILSLIILMMGIVMAPSAGVAQVNVALNTHGKEFKSIKEDASVTIELNGNPRAVIKVGEATSSLNLSKEMLEQGDFFHI